MIRQSTIPFLCGYATKGKVAALSAPTTQQLAVFNVRAWNRTGGAINVGICRLLAAGGYQLYVKASSYTLKTAAQILAGVQVVDTTDNHGFLISGKKKFSLVGFTVSDAAANGTYAIQYWNGSAWTTLTTFDAPTNLASAADTWIAFLPPVDWTAGSDASGPSATDYQIRVIATSHPDDTGSINALWVGEVLDYYKGLGDNNAMQIICDSDRPLILEQGEGLFPYFSSANAANAFGAFYSVI